MTRPGRPKNRRYQWSSEERELAALVQEMRIRVLNCSANGCLLESDKQVRAGTIATLQLSFAGQTFSDLVKIVRCEDVDQRAGLYHIATEFLMAAPASARSLRHLIRCESRRLAEWLTGPWSRSAGQMSPAAQTTRTTMPAARSKNHRENREFSNILTCSPDTTSGRESGKELADLVSAAQPTATNKQR